VKAVTAGFTAGFVSSRRQLTNCQQHVAVNRSLIITNYFCYSNILFPLNFYCISNLSFFSFLLPFPNLRLSFPLFKDISSSYYAESLYKFINELIIKDVFGILAKLKYYPHMSANTEENYGKSGHGCRSPCRYWPQGCKIRSRNATHSSAKFS